jgi:hypothetical protein
MSGGSANAVHVAPGASVYIVTRASGDGSDSDRPNLVSDSSDSSSDSSKEASDCPSAPEKLPRDKVRHSKAYVAEKTRASELRRVRTTPWTLDSDCSHSVSPHADEFKTFTPAPGNKFTIANGEVISGLVQGSVSESTDEITIDVVGKGNTQLCSEVVVSPGRSVRAQPRDPPPSETVRVGTRESSSLSPEDHGHLSSIH